MISDGFRHYDILRSYSFDCVTFFQRRAVKFSETFKCRNLVFVHRDLWAVWGLERPHLLFLGASGGALRGSDWSSQYATSWNSEFKNTSLRCHQSWQDWGSWRGTKGGLHYSTNDLSCVRYVFLSFQMLNWTDLHLLFLWHSHSRRLAVHWDFLQHPSVTLKKIKITFFTQRNTRVCEL